MENNANNSRSYITFILKCTRNCNLCCVYCKDHLTELQKNIDIPFLAHLFDETSRLENINKITFVWHGGEPLLLGLPYFRKTHYLQEQFFTDKVNFLNTLQTNACLLTSDWVAHLQKYDFQLGISLDGPKFLHDNARKMANGKGSFRKVMAGIEILQKADINFGILTVITDAHFQMGAVKLMNFFEEYSIKKYALLSLRGDWNDPKDVINYNKKYANYMTDVINEWFKKDDLGIKIRELDSKLDIMFGLPNGVCKDGGSCVGRYFSIESNGSVWHCDKFHSDNRFYFGNLSNQSLKKILNSWKVEQAQIIELSIRKQCEECKWYDVCKGGCFFDLMNLLENNGRVGTSDCIHFNIFEELSKFTMSYLNNYEK